MAVVFDTSILILAVNPDAKAPRHPETNAPLECARQRVDYLIRNLSRKKSRIIIPTPTLCELLTHADEAVNDYLKQLCRSPFEIAPFDIRAAIGCAQVLRKYGIKGAGRSNPRAKVKFDRQIVAIAQVYNVEAIYSDDSDIFRYGQQAGIKVVRCHELEIDPADRQHDLNFGGEELPATPMPPARG
jgi:predicted nucleic acid-binding protein